MFITGWRLVSYTMAGSEIGLKRTWMTSSATNDDTCPLSLMAPPGIGVPTQAKSRFVDDFWYLATQVLLITMPHIKQPFALKRCS